MSKIKNTKIEYFSGTVDIGKDRTLYVNTKTGEGVQEICDLLKKFVYFQTSKISFPSYSADDVSQEIYALAIEAIPKYDNTKNANMLTFLHNHVKNRIINLCKFHSEKRRISRYTENNTVKLRCNACRNFFPSSAQAGTNVRCPSCKATADFSDPHWKKYNIAMVPLSYTSSLTKDEDSTVDSEGLALFDRDGDTSGFMVAGHIFHPSSLNTIVDLERATEELDDTNKEILKRICQGYSIREIAVQMSMNQRILRNKVSKITEHMSNFLGVMSGKQEPSALR